MPLVDLICLANSNKMGGRCIAGLRTDGGGWVRLAWRGCGASQVHTDYIKNLGLRSVVQLEMPEVELAVLRLGCNRAYPTSTICAKPGDASATHLVGIGQT